MSDNLTATEGAREAVQARFAQLESAISKAFVGDPQTLRHLFVGLLAGGHVLIEDVPGVGKTTLARALARCLDASFNRVQFTPDLLPADILGVSIYDPEEKAFRFQEGPIFCQVLLADEINRTPPRTQSALLESMNEGQVTVDGETRQLPDPFFVIATMNPVDSHGTYELPESQTDRFLLRLGLGYPAREQSRALLRGEAGQDPLAALEPVMQAADLVPAQRVARAIHVAPEIEDYLLDLIEATRGHPQLPIGASPRAAIGLHRAAQAAALLDGRDHVLPDDVKDLALPVLSHRFPLEGGQIALVETALREIIDDLKVP